MKKWELQVYIALGIDVAEAFSLYKEGINPGDICMFMNEAETVEMAIEMVRALNTKIFNLGKINGNLYG